MKKSTTTKKATRVLNYQDANKGKHTLDVRYLRDTEADKITALKKANITIKNELESLLNKLSIFNASKLESQNDVALLSDKTIQKFIDNYLKVSKQAYDMPIFKDHKKALFNISKTKDQPYLKPAFLFLTGFNKNRIHYLQLLYKITISTSPKEIEKLNKAWQKFESIKKPATKK